MILENLSAKNFTRGISSFPLPEGRDRDGKDIESVEEVHSERALPDLFLQKPIGRGEDAHVCSYGMRAADPLKLSVLNHLQQLGLQVERQFADLVEKQSASVGQFKAADLSGSGACVGAFFTAEKLALNQCWRQAGAVHMNKQILSAIAGLMKSARKQPLAVPVSPVDRCLCAGDLPDPVLDIFDRVTVADNALQIGPHLHFLTKVNILRFKQFLRSFISS